MNKQSHCFSLFVLPIDMLQYCKLAIVLVMTDDCSSLLLWKYRLWIGAFWFSQRVRVRERERDGGLCSLDAHVNVSCHLLAPNNRASKSCFGLMPSFGLIWELLSLSLSLSLACFCLKTQSGVVHGHCCFLGVCWVVCMASDDSCKKHLFFFFFFVMVISAESIEGLKPSARRFLSSPSSSSQTMEELGRQRPGLPSPYHRFESRKHEVPSGPNPVSNR